MITKSPLDICFQSLDSQQTFQNICCLTLLDQAVNHFNLRTQVVQNAKHYPKLNLSLGPLESKFFLNPSQNKITPTIQLEDSTLRSFLNEFCETLKPNSLPWKILYTQETEEKNILSFMLSHALGDGVSGLDFFHSLSSDYSPPKDSKPERETKQPRFIGALRSLIKEAIGKPNHYKVNGINSNKRELLLLSMPYDALKHLKKENSTTAYSILLALVSYLVSEYFQVTAKGVYLKPLLPVSIRGKNRPKDLSNQIGGATISLPLGFHSPKELIQNISNNLKTHLTEDAFYGYYLWAFILSKLPMKFRKKLLEISARKTSFICTNLIGPNLPLEIAGARVEEQYVIPALMPGHGLGFGFMKSNKKMQVAIIYDPAIIDDSKRLRGSLEKALTILGITTEYAIKQS